MGVTSNPGSHWQVKLPGTSMQVPFPQTSVKIEHSSILLQVIPCSSKAYPWFRLLKEWIAKSQTSFFLKYPFLSLFIIAFLSQIKIHEFLVKNSWILAKYLHAKYQDLCGKFANSNHFFGLFVTHSFTNSTLIATALKISQSVFAPSVLTHIRKS